MIESNAKELVVIRHQAPGMHWSEQGAIAITAVGPHSLSHNWNEFWKNLLLNC